MELKGCYSAIPTPFTENGVDEETLARHAQWMVDEGVSGVVVVGTTGESATMSDDEKIRAIQVVSEAVGQRATVVGGAGNNSTSESLEFVRRVNKETDVDAIMSVVPYYTKPPQEGILAHFRAIADESEDPVIIYNVPGRTGVSMTPRTMIEASRHTNIVGIKEASGEIHPAGKLLAGEYDLSPINPDSNDDISGVASHVSLFSGDDGTSMAFLALGGHGIISVASNVAPFEMARLCAAVEAGDLATAQRYNRVAIALQDLLFHHPNPIPTKILMRELGFGNGMVRLPLVALDNARESALIDAFNRLSANEGLHRPG